MNNRIVTSLGLVLLMLTAGCIGNVHDEIITELPDDWRTQTSRTISQPHLVQFDSCLSMEFSLKASIAEEYRTQLLQAVEEQYYYGWGMFDDGMVAESAMDGDASAGAHSRKHVFRVKISVAPTTKSRALMRRTSSKRMDTTSMLYKDQHCRL